MDEHPDFEIGNGVLIRYTGEAEFVVIPEGVTEIGQYAFADCPLLTHVTVPDSVTEIGKATLGFGDVSLTPPRMDGFTVCGGKGTAAERYAELN